MSRRPDLQFGHAALVAGAPAALAAAAALRCYPARMGVDAHETAVSADDSSTRPGHEDRATAWVTIRRTSPEDIKERELYASLDGKRIAILRFGDEVTVQAPPGHHELRVHNTLSRKAIAFDASPGQHVRFKAVNVPGKGFALLAFFVGAALMWTALEREPDGSPPKPPTA